MRLKNAYGITFMIVAAFLLGLGCVTGKGALQAENSLPPERLATYQDPFDRLRSDLWEKGGMLYSKEQVENFRLADTRIENGRFVVTTQVGGFSKGGLVSTFRLQGDFDIQLDCEMDFLEGPLDMDSLLLFAVFEEGRTRGTINLAQVGLNKREGYLESHIYCNYMREGKKHRARPFRTKDFKGSFRFVRSGDRMAAAYKKETDRSWSEIAEFPFTTGDLVLSFEVQNFVVNKKHIKASKPVKAAFDNFRINKAEGIVESDI